jgi:hypothetical protein
MTPVGQNFGGSAPGGNSGDVFKPEYLEQPQSVDPNLEREARKNEVVDKCKSNRQGLNKETGDQLQRDVLTSYDDRRTVLDMNISVESKYENLYAGFISESLVATLNRNRSFSNSLMFKAAEELPKNVELKNLYKEAYTLVKENKDPNLKQKLDVIAAKIEIVLKSYSLVFDRNVFNKSLGFQSMGKTSSVLYFGLSSEQKNAYEAASLEGKMAILDEAAKASNNPELQKEWEEQKAALIEIEKAQEDEQKPKEEKKKTEVVQVKPTVDKKVDPKTVKAYEQANSAVSSAGYTVDSNGTMSLSPEISVHVEVDESGKYSFVDQYSSDGKIGPFDLKDLPAKAYERYIDNYVSRRVKTRLVSPNEVSEIKDGLLEGVGVGLIGDGSKKNYKVTGEDRIVLDRLAESLLLKDSKHESLRDKIQVLYDKFGAVRRKDDDKGLSREENAAMFARRKLLDTSKKYLVSELLG